MICITVGTSDIIGLGACALLVVFFCFLGWWGAVEDEKALARGENIWPVVGRDI